MIEHWTGQLNALREGKLLSWCSVFCSSLLTLYIEEHSARERFVADYGGFLPDDLCPYVSDLPVRWTIEGDGRESSVTLSNSVILEVRVLYPFQLGHWSINSSTTSGREKFRSI